MDDAKPIETLVLSGCNSPSMVLKR